MKVSLFAIACLLATLLFIPTEVTAEKAPRGYEHNNTPHKHGFRYSKSGEPVRRGKRAERYELRFGDCANNDCPNGRFRSEAKEKKVSTKAKVNRNTWIGWSFHVQAMPNFTARDHFYPFFGQWKIGWDSPPVATFLMHQKGNSNTFYVSLLHLAAENGGWIGKSKHGHVCKDVFSLSQAKSGWVDIVINTNFSDRQDGFFRVWVNGKLKCDYRGTIVPPNVPRDFSGPNHRRGIYLGNSTRWKKTHGNGRFRPIVVFYDEYAIGKQRIDVDVRMREAQGLKAMN